MYNKKKIVCLVTARSKSKGLKNKNIKKINNLSLIEHSVISGKKSKYVDDVYISTDSVKYAKLAKKRGAIIPFIRSKNLSGDKVLSMRVIFNFLSYLKKKKINYDYLVLLEPTSPMTSKSDIDRGIKILLKDKKFDSLVGISQIMKFDLKSIFSINRFSKISNINNKISNNFDRRKNKKIYFLDGSIYISKIDKLYSNKGFITKKTKGMIFPYHKSFEVDNKEDLKIIKTIFKK